jgi:peptidoglycan hydrolase CwlO-like protein
MDVLSIDNILQFIVLLSGLLATFIRFNNKTKEDNEKNYTKLELKISEVENDLKSIASDIGEIKGFIKQLSKI